MIECIYCQTIVSEVGSLISYYWRLFTNIDFMAGQPFGFWTLISFFTILSGLALLFLTFLIYRADPKNPKNRFITMMLLTESFRCLTVSIFWAYPYELEQIQSSLEPKLDKQWPTVQMNDERRIAIPNFVSGDLRELDEKVKSMMETSQNLRPDGASKAKICKVCGKEGAGIAIRDHIEANHLEGVSLPCNICGKEFRSRQRLRQHTCNRK